jgi:hypothetical protein
MLAAQYVPKRLALTGKLGMKRTDVVKMIGQLFTSRVDVNLCKLALPTSPPFIPLLIHLRSVQYARHAKLLLGL